MVHLNSVESVKILIYFYKICGLRKWHQQVLYSRYDYYYYEYCFYYDILIGTLITIMLVTVVI